MENVRCLLSRSPIPNPGLFDPAGTLPGRYIYRNRAELPRFYLVGRTRPAGSMAEAAAMLRAPDFRPAEEAIVEGAERPAAGSGGGQVEVLQYGFQTVELRVTSEGPAYLATSETHYPGWHAWIDGVPQPLHYTNVAFRGLSVPAGRHNVRMRFEPANVRWAAAVSGAAWLVWMLLWWRLPSAGAARRRGTAEPAPAPRPL
jgi:hypothetical protein